VVGRRSVVTLCRHPTIAVDRQDPVHHARRATTRGTAVDFEHHDVADVVARLRSHDDEVTAVRRRQHRVTADEHERRAPTERDRSQPERHQHHDDPAAHA
jgi:hypothetical protein